MTADSPIISELSERGTHSVSFNVSGVPDLEAHARSQTFCPAHVSLTFAWVTSYGVLPARGWHPTHIVVSGTRRLKDGSLGRERKQRSFGHYWEKDAPAWLVQLVGRFHPAYPVGLDNEGLPVLWQVENG